VQIKTNLHYLINSNLIGPGSVISNSQDDIDDDASSIYCPSTGRQKVQIRAAIHD
jgi:hypothetical protein